MTNEEIAKSLQYLTPNAEWHLVGDDLTGLIWLDKNQQQPTEKEIIQVIAKLSELQELELAAKKAAREALLEKLGITEEEAKLLLS